jgi:hypothetical protein
MVKFDGIQPTENPPTLEPALPASKPLSPQALRTSNGYSRPNGLSPFPASPITKFNWLWAREFVIKLQTNYLETVLKQPNMPSSSQINIWSEKYPKFKEWITRSRKIFADYLAERSASMFDEEPIYEVLQTKNGSYKRISMSGVQRERYKSQAMFNLAAKFNPDVYGEKINIQNTFDLSLVLNAASGGKLVKKLKRLQPEPEILPPTTT